MHHKLWCKIYIMVRNVDQNNILLKILLISCRKFYYNVVIEVRCVNRLMTL